jgi:hypothetical protein
MRFVGQDLLDYLRVVRERIEYAKSHSARWSIPCGDESIEALYLPRNEPEADEPRAALLHYIRAEGLDTEIAAVVYPDRRKNGYGIARYEDHPQLDFSRVDNEIDVHFAHKSGFMCKTSTTDPQRLRELLTKAWLCTFPSTK